MIRIRDVAKLAGVSPSTVSRVLNGTARVDPEKAARVMEIVERTGYVPNELARSLYKKSAKLIGLVIPSIRNPFFTQFASSLNAAANEAGYRIFLCDAGSGDPEREKAAVQMLMAMNADGIIAASAGAALRPVLERCPLPVVAVDTLYESAEVTACLSCDDYAGGRLATEHLWDCGCRNIVCIRGPQHVFSAKARYEGYRDVCQAHGLPAQAVDCDFDFYSGQIMAQTLLDTYPHVDGIFACNDVVAVSTYKLLHKRKIAVPEQIQLVGFDDNPVAGLLSPELTTVRQPVEEMAQKAISLIVEGKDAPKTGERFVFPVSLELRETTRRKEARI